MASNGARPDHDLATALASSVHELKTPLSIIAGFAELIERRREPTDGAELREMVAVIRRNATRLLRRVEELLVVAKLEAGKVRIDLAETDVLSVLEAAAHVATASGVAVEVWCSPGLRVRTDPDRLEEMLGTLVENSCRHGRPPVVIRADGSATGVDISVSDGGDGVPPRDVDDLFEAFSRLSSGKQGSNGLGLHTARRLAWCVEGDLAYQAEVNGGAFVLTIPDLADERS